MKRVLLIFCLFHCCHIILAQRPEKPLDEMEWQVGESGRYFYDSYDNDEWCDKSIVYLSSSEAVACVQFGKDEYGAIKVNENGKVAWECKLPGRMMGLGKMDDKIIAFYETNGTIGQIHAVILDAGKGQKLLDKIVYQSKEGTYDAITVQNRPSGNFSDLLVRTTLAKEKNYVFGGAGFPSFEGRVSSSSCKALFFNQDLAEVKVTDMKVYENYRFLGSIVNEEGDIYLVNKIDDDIAVDEYNGKSGATNRLHTPFEIKKESGFTPVFNIDTQNGQNLLAAIKYTNKDKDFIFQVFQFDFKTKKVGSSNPQVLDKPYAKSVEAVELKGIYKQRLVDGIESLRPVKIMRVSDKLVVFREVRYSIPRTNGNSLMRNGPVVVSFLDDQLKPLKELALLKQYDVFLDLGRSLGVHVQNDKLCLVSATLSGIGGCSNLICIINPSTMSSEKYEIVEKLALGSSVSAEPNATIWFDSSFLLNQIIPKGMIKRYKNTVLQKVKF